MKTQMLSSHFLYKLAYNLVAPLKALPAIICFQLNVKLLIEQVLLLTSNNNCEIKYILQMLQIAFSFITLLNKCAFIYSVL